MSDIRRVGGTSAGAITAVVIALGCDVERIDDLSSTLNFRDVLDDKGWRTPTQSLVLKSVGKIDEGSHWFWAKVPVKPVKIPLALRLLQDKGVYEGDYARNWIENMIREQVRILTNGAYDGTYLTFAGLHELTEKFPGVFRDLFVVGANLTTGKKIVFSYNNPETHDVVISDAVRISMSIPYLFKPHHIHYKVHGQRLVETARDFLTDGGVYDNYPIDMFDDSFFISEGDEPLQQADNGRFYNPQTLGFRLVSAGKKAYFDGTYTDQNEAKMSEDIKSFTNSVIKTNFALQEAFYSRPENVARTVYIDHLNVSTLAFDLSDEQRENLKQSGTQATHDYLDKHFPNFPKHEPAESSSSYSL